MFGLSDNVVEELREVFRGYSNIRRVLIFGSRAKGTSHIGSDIDLALDGEDITLSQQLDISSRIDDLGLLYKVDLLNYQKQKGTPIGEHIDRAGKVFYSRQTIV